MGFVIATTLGTGSGTPLIVTFAAVAATGTTVLHSPVLGPDPNNAGTGSHGTGTVVAGTSLIPGTMSVMDVHGLTVDNVGGNVETLLPGKEACKCIDVSDLPGNIMVVIGKGPVTGLVVSMGPVPSVLHTEETCTGPICSGNPESIPLNGDMTSMVNVIPADPTNHHEANPTNLKASLGTPSGLTTVPSPRGSITNVAGCVVGYTADEACC